MPSKFCDIHTSARENHLGVCNYFLANECGSVCIKSVTRIKNHLKHHYEDCHSTKNIYLVLLKCICVAFPTEESVSLSVLSALMQHVPCAFTASHSHKNMLLV